MLAGGVGAGALIALPDPLQALRRDDRPARSSRPVTPGSQYVLLYGMPGPGPSSGGSVAWAPYPEPRARGPFPASRTRHRLAAKSVAAKIASTPVLSPDRTTVALVTVHTAPAAAKVTLALVDAATAVISKQESLTITDIREGANILATPVFAPGTPIVALVLAITEPANGRQARKLDAHTGRTVPMHAVTWTSHHALAVLQLAQRGVHRALPPGQRAVAGADHRGRELFRPVLVDHEGTAAGEDPAAAAPAALGQRVPARLGPGPGLGAVPGSLACRRAGRDPGHGGGRAAWSTGAPCRSARRRPAR